jgi:hypothetical protein
LQTKTILCCTWKKGIGVPGSAESSRCFGQYCTRGDSRAYTNNPAHATIKALKQLYLSQDEPIF